MTVARPRQGFAVSNVQEHEQYHSGSTSSLVASLDISCVPEGAGAAPDRCTYQRKQRELELVVPQYGEKTLLPEDDHVEYVYTYTYIYIAPMILPF